jgi:hypothetical protein
MDKISRVEVNPHSGDGATLILFAFLVQNQHTLAKSKVFVFGGHMLFSGVAGSVRKAGS